MHGAPVAAPNLPPAVQLLIRALKDRERSQAWLARKVEVTPNSVSLWCRGLTRPEHHHRVALERELGVPADAWFTDDERRIAGLPPAQPEGATPTTEGR